MTSILAILLSLSSANAEYPDNSIFWLESKWTNQEGEKIQLKELGDSPMVVSMVFLGCKFTCPLTVQDMREMEAFFMTKKIDRYRMVLISIDPDRDTPQAMKKFMIDRKLNSGRWTLLASESENVREMAALLGYSYKKDEAMDFAHSMLTWVFDEKGVLRFTRHARKETNEETAKALIGVVTVKK